MLQQMSLECHILTAGQYRYWRTLQRTTNGGVNACCSNNEWRAGALRGLWMGCNTIEGLWLERMLQDTIDSNYGYMMQQNGNILCIIMLLLPSAPRWWRYRRRSLLVLASLWILYTLIYGNSPMFDEIPVHRLTFLVLSNINDIESILLLMK